MSTSKHIDKICCAVLATALILTVLFMNADKLGVQAMSVAVGYASRLFDTSTVHTIDIVMDDWDSFIDECINEEYANCTVIIDGEAYRNVAIRAKGNTSLSSVASYGNDRYSFKIEFDHYDHTGSYYGLDKLCLNNIIQDNTYMKDYLTYQLMQEFGVDAPLCSYSYITVNGDDWGLYLAVEGVEESFLQRNYGNDYGQLYKPDSMDMGGGRGNGRDFDMENLDFRSEEQSDDMEMFDFNPNNLPDTMGSFDSDFEHEMHGGIDKTDRSFNSDHEMKGGMSSDRVMGSSDVSLIYTDDEFDSYSNIFDSVKTNLSDADKTRLIESLKKLNNTEDIENVVNIDEVIRYFVVHNFVVNFDSYTGSMIHNYYLYEEDGQFSMIPWDYNLAFGGFESRSDATSLVNYPIDTPVSGGTIDSRPMLAWIFASEEYTDLYHQYFSEFIAQYFNSGYFADMIDTVGAMIAPYVESDPTKFCTYEEFEDGISTLREFCLLRAESVDGQLNGTIPSTSEGQAEDSSSLVDASGLTVSYMGSMGNTMGGGGFSERNEHFRDPDNLGTPDGIPDGQPEFGDMPDDMPDGQPEFGDMPDGMPDGQPEFGDMPDGMPGRFSGFDDIPGDIQGNNPNNRGERFNRSDRQSDALEAFNPFDDSTLPNMPNGNPTSNNASYLLLGISVVILLAGIVTALLFQRRRPVRHHQ